MKSALEDIEGEREKRRETARGREFSSRRQRRRRRPRRRRRRRRRRLRRRRCCSRFSPRRRTTRVEAGNMADPLVGIEPSLKPVIVMTTDATRISVFS